ncbi:MAG: helix-turn-helix domain-containing protein [Opitutaceae bacterium]|nr:helix-turn-helix domain-containing protein [Opitutaceae bacterium]
MKTAPRAAPTFAKLPKTYAGLMAMHLIRPIHDQVDADNAAEMIDRLAGHALNAEQSDYLDLLSDLYEKWESAQFPIARARGPELLRLALTERGDGAAELAKLISIDPSLAYRILRGERQLTAGQIRKVADTYGLDPAALLP